MKVLDLIPALQKAYADMGNVEVIALPGKTGDNMLLKTSDIEFGDSVVTAEVFTVPCGAGLIGIRLEE